MAPFYKTTMIFEARTNVAGDAKISRIAGWSESLYSAAQPSIVVITSLKNRRAALLPTTSLIIGHRVQRVLPVGASQVFTRPQFGTYPNTTDYPSMGVLVAGRAAGAGNTRRFSLRGIPDVTIHKGEYSPTDIMVSRMNAYLTYLANGVWGFLGRDLDATPRNIVSISELGVVTLTDGMALEAGQKVRIRGTRINDTFPVSGVFKVKTVTNSVTFSLLGWKYDISAGGTAVGASATEFFQFQEVVVVKSTTRRVGRPFNSFRGRASRRSA